jgi:hypothetical protein
VVLVEFWLGLTVRYRLPRRQRIESPSIGLVRDLLLGGSLRFDHLAFTFSLSSTKGPSCTASKAVTSGEIRDNRQTERVFWTRGAMLLEIIMRGAKFISLNGISLTVQTVNLLVDRITQDPSMFEVITAFFIVLSVGILLAHALDAFRR